MLLEMHAHTRERSACSHVSAADLLRQAMDRNVQGVVLTDHHALWSPEELDALRRSARIPETFRLFSGQEVRTREIGDVLVFGAQTAFSSGTTLAEIRAAAPEAAIVWAHPWRKGRQPAVETLLDPRLDAIEVLSVNHGLLGNWKGLEAWHRHRFTAMGGTDTHGPGIAGLYPTQFDHPPATIEELAAEIRAGRCRPFVRETARAGACSVVTEVVAGARRRDGERERFIVRRIDSPSSWKRIQRARAVMDQLIEAGMDQGQYRVPRPLQQNQKERLLVEEGVHGHTFRETMMLAGVAEARPIVRLAAGWLAAMHGLRLRITPEAEFIPQEEKKLKRYASRFADSRHSHGDRVGELVSAMTAWLKREFPPRAAWYLQGHGDYHPGNLLVGHERRQGVKGRFLAAIDFEQTTLQPPSFDCGYFLAQFRYQFRQHLEFLKVCSAEHFLADYEELTAMEEPDFRMHVDFFRARSTLGIAAYLVKLGRGDSSEVWRLLLEAEEIMTTLAETTP